ncbi:LysR family transcriptional regulator [Bordetella sp. LUAb4]|uniref:LysR family transcriptional regulator n=1 Tax=Bordetella sp. LUAb4 TaxID=2843195 RepID=UPI001E48E191|nr:LysR family transcriptional regulator [Bordetella sp. LUAb4]
MKISTLRYFVHVAAAGSFVMTARRFGVPQSTVSRQIAALEAELGQQLLLRHTRAVRLTEAGAQYLADVQPALNLLDAAADGLVGEDAPLRGVIRVNAPVSLGKMYIAPLLAAFQELHPAIAIELTLTDMLVDPIQESMDITVRIGKLADSGMVARTLGAQAYLLCASPSYLSRMGHPASPDDLKTHNCLLYRGQSGDQRWYFRRPGASDRMVCEVTGNFKSNNAEALVDGALAGRGIVLFPSWIFGPRAFAQGRLVPLLREWDGAGEPEPYDIHLLYPQGRLRSRKVKALSNFLQARIGSPPDWNVVL